MKLGALSPRSIAAWAVALLCGPILVDLAAHDRRRPFTYLASDAYYYLTVGWNFAHFGKLSYDQTHATNGYHPVWQLLESALFVLGRLFHLPELAQIYSILIASLVLLGAGVWLLARAMGRVSPLFVLLPLGTYGILAAPWLWREATNAPWFGFPLYGSLWNSVDGMETCVTTFAFCLAAWLYVRAEGRTRLRDGALVGASLALLTLSRLDHIFFAGMLLLGVAAHDLLGARRSPRHFLGALGAFVVPVAAYLLLNKLIVGTALPVSGMLKSTFPHASMSNWHRVQQTLRTPLATSTWRMYRLAQLLLPVPFTLLPLLFLRRARDRFDEVLLLCAPAVLFLFAYDFWFVDLMAHGHWYFPVSTLFMSLSVLRAVPAPRFGRVTVLIGAAVCIFAFVKLNGRLGYGAAYADFYFDVAPKVRDFYAKRGGPPPGVIENDDGIIAFSTHFPCMSGSGLNLDPEAFAAYRAHRLVPLAMARGYDRLATVMYGSVLSLMPYNGQVHLESELQIGNFTVQHAIPDPPR